ncbi:hypothetical protein [Streptomyces sp. HUAS ZL42]|uniref:hypothetical protein n=1 Tax=Streptomyces sp. HUAS ZL42 TaxID=3231715 RepID=UPI00345E7831
MSSYLVRWDVDLDASDPVDATREALAIQRDPCRGLRCSPCTAGVRPGLVTVGLGHPRGLTPPAGGAPGVVLIG